MSDYFDYSTGRLVSGTTARAGDVNNTFDEIDTGLDKLPSEANLKGGLINYAVDTGAADAYVVALPYTATAYTDGMQVVFKATAVNTGACTINVDSLGAKSITRQDGSAPIAGDIAADKITEIRYNSTSGNFEIQGSIGAAAGTGTMALQNANAVAITGGTADFSALSLGGTAVTTLAGEINILDGATISTAEINILDGATFTTAEANTAADGISNPPLAGDSTAGRSFRIAELVVDDGTTASTVKCTLTSVFNGDAISETDNITGVVGDFSLTGYNLTIQSSGITGTCVGAIGVLHDNNTATVYNVKIENSTNITIYLYNSDYTSGISWATAVDSGDITVRLLYITTE